MIELLIVKPNQITNEARDLFNFIDADNKGFITFDDVKNSPKLIPSEVLHSIDFKNRSRLTLEEFAYFYENLNKEFNAAGTPQSDEGIENEDYVDDLFKTNGSREFITKEDVLNDNISITNEQFDAFDVNNDGKLSKEELKKVQKSTLKNKFFRAFLPKTKIPVFKTTSLERIDQNNKLESPSESRQELMKASEENLHEEKKGQQQFKKKFSLKNLSKKFSIPGSQESIVEKDLVQNGPNESHSELSVDSLIEKLKSSDEQLAQEKELRIKFENDYNDLKIELRFMKEKQIDLEEELNETLKAKKMAEEENLSLIYVNKVMEEKLIAATELIDQLKQNENESLDRLDTETEIDKLCRSKSFASIFSSDTEIKSHFKDVPPFMKPERKFKCILLGNAGVGKTAFIKRICYDTYNETLSSTIGFDFDRKSIFVDNQKVVSIELWDTAGQERFSSMTKSYYRGTDCFICLFGVDDLQSFLNLRNWLTSINETSDGDIRQIVIIANKIDLINANNPRAVEECDAEALAKENNALYFEISTKSGLNVFEATENIVKELMVLIKRPESICDTCPKNEKKTNSSGGWCSVL